MGRESLFSSVLFGFCTVGLQDGMLCLWVVSRFELGFCCCCCFTLGRQNGMLCLWVVSRFFLVLFGFFTLGRQDGMLCLWPVSRFVLGFCWGFVRLDVRMESFAYGS